MEGDCPNQFSANHFVLHYNNPGTINRLKA